MNWSTNLAWYIVTSESVGSGTPSGRRLRFGDGEPAQCRGAGRLLDVCLVAGTSAELYDARDPPDESRAEASDEPLRRPREFREV